MSDDGRLKVGDTVMLWCTNDGFSNFKNPYSGGKYFEAEVYEVNSPCYFLRWKRPDGREEKGVILHEHLMMTNCKVNVHTRAGKSVG